MRHTSLYPLYSRLVFAIGQKQHCTDAGVRSIIVASDSLPSLILFLSLAPKNFEKSRTVLILHACAPLAEVKPVVNSIPLGLSAYFWIALSPISATSASFRASDNSVSCAPFV